VSKNRKKDPHYKREKLKYDDPIPSREFILQTMEEVGRPVSLKQLLKKLELVEEAKIEALGFRLKAMLRDGQIMQDRRNRYCLLKKLNLLKGTVQGHPEGFGFFIPEDGGKDMFLGAREMRSVMHGDKVLAYQTGFDRRGRPEAKVHEVVEHANKTVVGRFISDHGVFFVQPDSKRLTQDIFIPVEYANHCQFQTNPIIAQPHH
jgi:ribonuclease R